MGSWFDGLTTNGLGWVGRYCALAYWKATSAKLRSLRLCR